MFKIIRRVFPRTIPVLAGYLFLGIAYGAALKDKGFVVEWALLISTVVYTGSMQKSFLLCTMAVMPACFFLRYQMDGKKATDFVTWLSGQLPRAVMAMLMIHCIKDLSFSAAAEWLPARLHLWKRQMTISILGGTALYMILVRLMG